MLPQLLGNDGQPLLFIDAWATVPWFPLIDPMVNTFPVDENELFPLSVLSNLPEKKLFKDPKIEP